MSYIHIFGISSFISILDHPNLHPSCATLYSSLQYTFFLYNSLKYTVTLKNGEFFLREGYHTHNENIYRNIIKALIVFL